MPLLDMFLIEDLEMAAGLSKSLFKYSTKFESVGL